MVTIWKAQVDPNSLQGTTYNIPIRVHKGSKFLTVQKQGAGLCVWFEVDPNAPEETQYIYCVGTGFGTVPVGKRYLSTVVDGQYVWHFYC